MESIIHSLYLLECALIHELLITGKSVNVITSLMCAVPFQTAPLNLGPSPDCSKKNMFLVGPFLFYVLKVLFPFIVELAAELKACRLLTCILEGRGESEQHLNDVERIDTGGEKLNSHHWK